LIIGWSAKLIFVRSTGEAAESQLRIMFPPNHARLELASDGSGKPDPIALKVTGGTGPLTVLVNGQPLPQEPCQALASGSRRCQ
jgi:Penicillin-Binding Protein C-terminus Family